MTIELPELQIFINDKILLNLVKLVEENKNYFKSLKK